MKGSRKTGLASWSGFVETTVRYELEPTPKGTRVVVTHLGIPTAEERQQYSGGWPQVLGWLASHAGRSR